MPSVLLYKLLKIQYKSVIGKTKKNERQIYPTAPT